jgi:hypothetical protein
VSRGISAVVLATLLLSPSVGVSQEAYVTQAITRLHSTMPDGVGRLLSVPAPILSPSNSSPVAVSPPGADGNRASVTQIGTHNVGTISQIGAGNAATLIQHGSRNTALISQNGRSR